MTVEHRIEDFLREINPVTFSAAAHGEGHRVVRSEKEARLYRKGLLDRLIGANNGRQFFVKQYLVPKEIKGWQFHWSEGTSALSLDFDSSFVIQANEDIQALKVVEVLAGTGPGSPGDSLHGVINASLHRELERLLQECNDRATSLLDCFRSSAIGIGVSESLNSRVSTDISHTLGGSTFRIGFQLKNSPPTQIEVSREDEFDLKDSRTRRKATTKALLQLVNYQKYKKSGRETEADIRAAIEIAITQSVKDLLWGRPYYDVVRAFRNVEAPLEKEMQRRIVAEAQSIGYDVTMFQTFPDIAALKLLEWRRIDIPAGEEKFALKNIGSDVQVDLALMVRASGTLANLHLLVEPDEMDALVPIARRISQICRDLLKSVTWEEFNLQFDALVKGLLGKEIQTQLGRYGLETEIIRIAQAPTEDANRFKALRGRTTDFALVITAQGDAGAADALPLRGTIDITGMPSLGWNSFEAKDFGFRDDTRVTEARMRQEAQRRELHVSGTSPLAAEERRALAIDLELLEIRDRVINTLQESLSKVNELVSTWRSVEASRHFITQAEAIATKAIEQEFGLCIALRGVVRDDSITESTALLRLQKANVMVRHLLDQDVDRETKLGEVRGQHAVAMATNVGVKDVEALDNEQHPRHETARQQAEGQLVAESERLTADSAARLLEAPEGSEKKKRELPKLTPPPDSGNRPGAAP